MTVTINGTTGITSPGGDTSTSLATGTLTVTGATSNVNAVNTFGFKNRIINGGMVIDQRNNGASVTQSTSAQYTVDRFAIYGNVASKFTAQQNAGSVTPPAGYTNYLGITSSSAYTVGASEQFLLWQRVEGLNMTDLDWGTANAKTVTLSFWVRSSLTGTFGGILKNSASTYAYPYTYTISAANTWEQKSITITGPTTGTWLTTNGIGINVYWGLGVGATLSAVAGAWTAGDYSSATGAVSVVGTSGATFYLTGVQLEVGSQATSFDFRSYGTELALCQRYFQTGLMGTGFAENSAACSLMIPFPVAMRASPSMAQTAVIQVNDGGNNYTQSAVNITYVAGVGTQARFTQIGSFTGLTTNRPYIMNFNGATGTLTASAEL